MNPSLLTRLASGSLAALCAFMPMACNTDGDDGGPSASDLFMAFVSIDREAKTVRTVSEDWNCDTDPPTMTKDTVTTHYRIEGGKLKIWDEDDCDMIVFSGTVNDLVGRWETTIANNYELSPDAPTSCLESSGGEDDLTALLAYDNFKMTLDITEQGARATYEGTFCGARMNAASLMGFTDAQGASEMFTVSKLQCMLVEGMRKSDEKPIKVTSSNSGSQVTTKVEFNGKTCSYVSADLLRSSGAQACSGIFDFEAYFAYLQCLSEAGLSPDGGDWEEELESVRLPGLTFAH
jgi:hypothetical protein